MNQYRYQVKHLGCGRIEVVGCYSDANDKDRDDEIKHFTHECHIAKWGREDGVKPCQIALQENNPQYKIIKRRF